MEQLYTFHKTVRGQLHIMNEIPCEDFSESLSEENGRYHIIIIADGHGSAACFRSAVGSKIVVEVTMECLKEYAESMLKSTEIEERFYKDLFFNPRYRQMTLKQLTDTIIARWNDRILEDYNNTPPSIEEMGDYVDMYKDGKNISHIYGTTLIAALMLPSCLILLHQGDGRCDVFFEDGSIEQPIPWDLRCEGTAVTSLCDDDAAQSFRTQVIDLTKQKVIACYLGSDGVEDAYRDTYEELGGSHILMGGVHTFYKDLTCQIAKMSSVEFENYLAQMLPEFSANGRFSRSGSGDDISVAGIVNVDAIKAYVEPFEVSIKKYSLEEALFWKENELRGKIRKHGILLKRMKEAEEALDNEKKELGKLLDSIQRLEKIKIDLEKKVKSEKNKLEEYEKQCTTGKFEETNQKFPIKIVPIQSGIQISYRKIGLKENLYVLLEELGKVNGEINKRNNEYSNFNEKVNLLQNEFDIAKSNFEEYDAKYQAIDTERKSILSEISALDKVSQSSQ